MNGSLQLIMKCLVPIILAATLPHSVAAETPAAKQARCAQYAARAAAQYNEAIAHPQCSINVDLMWQPSRDYHYQACMAVSKEIADGQMASRDNVLQACAAAAPVVTAPTPLPTQLEECERSLFKFCGTWTKTGAGYTAQWSNGAKATFTITRFDGHTIALHRVDTGDSTSAGMVGDYLGTIDGGSISGKATFSWPGHFPVGYATWTATFTLPAPAAPAAAP